MVRWNTRVLMFANWVASRFGYTFQKNYKSELRGSIPDGAKLYVGCGEQQLEGYLGCDLRPLPHVVLACRAWEVSKYATGLSEIYSRHMLEHLTIAEAELALRDWHRALSDDGVLRIEVPNIRFAMQQWLRADWTELAMQENYSDARWGTAGLFGWQRECDPMSENYNVTYWDVHKSGYDQASIRFLLSKVGFHEIETHLDRFTDKQLTRRKLASHASDGCHLIAIARKASNARRNVA